MSASSPVVQDSVSKKPCPFDRYVKPWLTPYYFTVAGVLGGITVFFGVVTVLLILVISNFNVLGWIE
jgi:hypothetical protein